jgi:hypothetical protein
MGVWTGMHRLFLKYKHTFFYLPFNVKNVTVKKLNLMLMPASKVETG